MIENEDLEILANKIREIIDNKKEEDFISNQEELIKEIEKTLSFALSSWHESMLIDKSKRSKRFAYLKNCLEQYCNNLEQQYGDK